MRCPKCEEGTINKIKFKSNGQIAYLCDFCDEMWFENEHIGILTGQSFRDFSEGKDVEYSFDELAEKDYEHQSIDSVKR